MPCSILRASGAAAHSSASGTSSRWFFTSDDLSGASTIEALPSSPRYSSSAGTESSRTSDPFHEAAPTAPSPQQRLMLSLAEKLHSHIFRATGATLMAVAGMDLVRLSLLLGHASPETTQRYYLAAEQLDLPHEVELICRRVQEALASASSSSAFCHSPLGWYERKGYAVGEKGGTHGRRSMER